VEALVVVSLFCEREGEGQLPENAISFGGQKRYHGYGHVSDGTVARGHCGGGSILGNAVALGGADGRDR
jgi:hypothetical protein